MKIRTNKEVDEVGGAVESNEFRISSSSQGMVMDALINLYSDPIGSIVREVTSNCIDSHRERDLKISGKIPLDVGDDLNWFHSRNTIEIEYVPGNELLGIGEAFIFKDFGNGLSEERVRNIYTTFGESTKRDDDLQIGGFGIGAKSPFAYVDTFYVKTRYNGSERIYMLYRGGLLPAMDKVYETTTVSKNGTEVIIPLKDAVDVSKFIDAAQRQLPFFRNIVYVGIGGLGDITQYSIIEETPEYALVDDKKATSALLVGNVVYPINWNLIKEEGIYAPVFIKFAIGELDLVPSRESIRYTDRTINQIKSRLEAIRTKFRKDVENFVATETDFIKWFKTINEVGSYKNKYYSSYSNFSSEDPIAIKAYVSKFDPKEARFNNTDIPVFSLNVRGRLALGFELQEVNRSYSGRSKATSITKSVSLKLSPDRPLYLLDGNYSRAKDITLVQSEGSFIGIKDTGITDWHVDYEYKNGWDPSPRSKETLEEHYKTIKGWLLSSSLVYNYSEVEDSSEVSVKTESEAARRKKEQKVFFRRAVVNLDRTYSSDLEDSVSFSNEEKKVKEIDQYKGEIIYGFQSDHKKLMRVAYMASMSTKYTRRSDENPSSYFNKIDVVDKDKLLVVKIAKSAEKHFVKATYVEDFFVEKHQLLKDFVTAIEIENRLESLAYLRSFSYFSKLIYGKFKELTKFKIKHLDSSYYLGVFSKLNKELVSFGKENGLLLEDKIKVLEELEEYTKGLGLLEYIPDLTSGRDSLENKIEDEALISLINEYLVLKGKQVDKVPEVLEEEVTQ